MREITTHLDDKPGTVRLFAEGDPGPGGSSWQYRASLGLPGKEVGTNLLLKFQHGPPSEVGPNGLTNECLLAVLIDRLHAYQAGPCSCTENIITLRHLEKALQQMHRRSKDRLARGVEGTLLP